MVSHKLYHCGLLPGKHNILQTIVEQLMEDGHKRLTPGAQVVGEQVDASPYNTPRWFTPRRDIDWDAVDFRWILHYRDRQERAEGLLERINHRLHLGWRWLRFIVHRRRG